MGTLGLAGPRAFGRRETAIASVAAFLAVALTALGLVIGRGDERTASPGEAYGKLPLSFVPNQGQTDARVRYQAQAAGVTEYLLSDRARIALQSRGRSTVLDLRFRGANRAASITPTDRQPGKVNYLSATRSHTDLPTYGAVRYAGLWPGVDMTFRGGEGRLEYMLEIAPGADPTAVGLAYAGAESLSVTKRGDLRIHTANGVFTDSRPVAYQSIDGRRVAVESRFSLAGGTRYGFELGRYDHGRPLIIDPTLAYSTFLGGTSSDEGHDIDVDAAGSAYVTGITNSADFPSTPGAFDTTRTTAGFVTKLSPDGSSLVYSTFIDGATIGEGIAVDAAGNAVVAGQAVAGLPTTPGAFDESFNGGSLGQDAFVTKLNLSGSGLVYSTYLGGSSVRNNQQGESAREVALDPSGNAYVTGYTDAFDFPVTPGAYKTVNGDLLEGFVTKLNPTGSTLVYSTFLGGSLADYGTGIAVGGSGNAYVTGQTVSTDFPVTPGAYLSAKWARSTDAYLTKLSVDGSSLDFSTYLGAFGGQGVVVDDQDSAYVAATDVIKFDSAGTFVFRTPPASGGFPFEVDVDAQRNAYIAGQTDSPDAFVEKLSPSGVIVYSATFGGGDWDRGLAVAIDGNGAAYTTGFTRGVGFPTTPGAYDTTFNNSDAFVTKLEIPQTGRIEIVKNVGFDSPQDFSFTASGGLTPASFQLDDDSDGTLSNTQAFENVLTGDGYSVSEAIPAGWYQGAATCDNGSSPSNILVKAGETTTCTFTNSVNYPRPGGGTPLRVPLVPAFKPCGGAKVDSTHAAPLSLPSCSAVEQSSALLTTSTVGNMVGYVRLDAVAGNPFTTTDEANVNVSGSITDVRNTVGGSDYVEQVIFAIQTRFTDRANGSPAVLAGTTQGFEFGIPVTCVPNSSNSIGSTCSFSSSYDSLVPGSAREGKRSVITSTAIKVKDAGPDHNADPGSACPPTCGTGDERTFLDQGVFLP
jgi:hypothetical protein